MTTATLLLSGGLDSTTLLAHLQRQGVHLHALAVDYGQRHERELESAEAIAAEYDVPLDRVDLSHLGLLLPSALTARGLMPEGHYTADSMAATVVPNRNAILLSVAAAHASARGYDKVATAVHAGDHHIYPDCRPEFIGAFSDATWLSCGVSIAARFMYWTKTDIARHAVRLGVPIDLTWSCYRGWTEHCGRCGTCVERAEALHHATDGNDPTRYTDPDFWRGVAS